MGSMIASYKSPTSAVELAETVRLFLAEELGFCVDLSRLGEGRRITVEIPDSKEDVELLASPYGNAYVLSDAEAEVVDAMRARKGTWRPDVISGLRTPKTPAELREWVRLAIDACTPLVATTAGDRWLSVQFEEGDEASLLFVEGHAGGVDVGVALPEPAGSFWVHDLRACLTLDDGRTGEMLACEIRRLPLAEWGPRAKAYAKAGWNAKGLDDGTVLAVRIVDEHGRGAGYYRDEPAGPEVVGAVRAVRSWLMTQLEGHPDVDLLDLSKGADGGGVFEFEFVADRESRATESIRIKLGHAPER